MSTETEKQQTQKHTRPITLQIKASDATRLKVYYNEYVTTCQQNQYAVVDFHHFILQFAEMGFFSWRDRNKGK